MTTPTDKSIAQEAELELLGQTINPEGLPTLEKARGNHYLPLATFSTVSQCKRMFNHCFALFSTSLARHSLLGDYSGAPKMTTWNY